MKVLNKLNNEQENFFQIVKIEKIIDNGNVINCIDLTIEDDESFILGNGIVSHNSALGSLVQQRDPKLDAAYALKGKIKNARTLSDLSTNKEIIEMMQILNLDPDGENDKCAFDNIIIATDSDFDGYHIRALLINLFFLWFPWIIKTGKLHFLETPIISTGETNKKKYYYTMEDFNNDKKASKINLRYLKGLGSLSIDDWAHVMESKRIIKVTTDKSSKKNLEMAFGKSTMDRKKWLS